MTIHTDPFQSLLADFAGEFGSVLGPNAPTAALHLAASLTEFAAYERAVVSPPSDTAALILIAAALSRTAGGAPDALRDIEDLARAILGKAGPGRAG